MVEAAILGHRAAIAMCDRERMAAAMTTPNHDLCILVWQWEPPDSGTSEPPA